MCRYIVTSLELSRDKTVIACNSALAVADTIASIHRTHHDITCIEVTPVTLFMPSGATVGAYAPLPRGTRKAVTA